MSQTRIHIFRTGTHTAMDGTEIAFSAADLAAIAAAYDPARHEAPVVVGHPRHDHPAYGWVRRLVAEGDDLVAEVGDLEPAFADQLRARRYAKISAAFYGPAQPNNPTPGVFALKHVGFLGGAAPAVKGLRPVQFADPAHLTVEIAFGEREAGAMARIARVLRGVRDLMIGQVGVDAVAAAIPEHEITDLAAAAAVMVEEATPPQFSDTEPPMPDPTPAPEPTPAPDLAAREAALAAREAELAAQASDIAARQAAFAEAERTRRREGLAARVDALVTGGRIAPAARADALAFAAALDDGSVAFSDGPSAPADWWLRQIEAAQPLIAFGEMARPDKSAAPAQNTPDAIAAAARKLMAQAEADGRKLTFAAAVRQVEKDMEA